MCGYWPSLLLAREDRWRLVGFVIESYEGMVEILKEPRSELPPAVHFSPIL
jgi:hypothetical protein